MLIQAVIEPSEEAREHLRSALGRHLARTEVGWYLPQDWRVRVATFGYLAFGDMTKLEDTMREKVSALPAMTLRMRGVVPLPEENDDGVWVELDGDLEPLTVLAQEIPGWVHGLGYMLDRNGFRPRIKLARVNSRTTVPYLEELMRDLDGYAGPAWTADALQIARRKAEGTPAALYRTHVTLALDTSRVAARVGMGAAGGVAVAGPAPSSLPSPRPWGDSTRG